MEREKRMRGRKERRKIERIRKRETIMCMCVRVCERVCVIVQLQTALGCFGLFGPHQCSVATL